jgi:hypothetical protein
MKQYVIDQLRPEDLESIKSYLDERFGAKAIAGIYWIPLDSPDLTEIQADHTACQPFYFAVELLPTRLSCELLVRSRNIIRCNCIQYATQKQRNRLIDLIDGMFEHLEIKI